ncbi:MAG: hypothetical protein MI674_00055, partial [Cytophagales bacterium]|nr:hypothetical protein [Cytophagales bacterium]
SGVACAAATGWVEDCLALGRRDVRRVFATQQGAMDFADVCNGNDDRPKEKHGDNGNPRAEHSKKADCLRPRRNEANPAAPPRGNDDAGAERPSAGGDGKEDAEADSSHAAEISRMDAKNARDERETAKIESAFDSAGTGSPTVGTSKADAAEPRRSDSRKRRSRSADGEREASRNKRRRRSSPKSEGESSVRRAAPVREAEAEENEPAAGRRCEAKLAAMSHLQQEKAASGHQSTQRVRVFCQEWQYEFGYARRFLSATYFGLWRQYQAHGVPHRHFYEIIRQSEPCHLYFDVEYMKCWNREANGDEMIDILLTLVDKQLT